MRDGSGSPPPQYESDHTGNLFAAAATAYSPVTAEVVHCGRNGKIIPPAHAQINSAAMLKIIYLRTPESDIY